MAKRFQNEEQARAYVQSLPLNQLVETCVQLLVDDLPERIIISQEQFEKFFRIRGFQADGSVENRGKKKL